MESRRCGIFSMPEVVILLNVDFYVYRCRKLRNSETKK